MHCHPLGNALLGIVRKFPEANPGFFARWAQPRDASRDRDRLIRIEQPKT